MLLATAMLMCFVARVSLLHLGGLSALGVALAFLLMLGSPNRAARLESYLGLDLFQHTETEEVSSDQAEGYQAQQARIAFAMGGLTGVGPGKSTQRDFLPAPYNDFIFAIVAEEYGFLGALALLGAFLTVLFSGIFTHCPTSAGSAGVVPGRRTDDERGAVRFRACRRGLRFAPGHRASPAVCFVRRDIHGGDRHDVRDFAQHIEAMRRTMSAAPNILFAAGGTGGHVYPAIAVADALRRRIPDAHIRFAGTRDRMEWRTVPEAGYEIFPITAGGLHRDQPFRNLALPVQTGAFDG